MWCNGLISFLLTLSSSGVVFRYIADTGPEGKTRRFLRDFSPTRPPANMTTMEDVKKIAAQLKKNHDKHWPKFVNTCLENLDVAVVRRDKNPTEANQKLVQAAFKTLKQACLTNEIMTKMFQ